MRARCAGRCRAGARDRLRAAAGSGPPRRASAAPRTASPRDPRPRGRAPRSTQRARLQPLLPSSQQPGPDDAELGQWREPQRAVEDVVTASLDAVKCRTVEPREGADAGRAARIQRIQQLEPLLHVRARARGLEPEQCLPLRRDAPGLDVLFAHAVGRELVLRQVDAAELPVLAHVANDVDQLQRDAERLGALRVLRAVDGDAGDADGAGDVLAVAMQLLEVVVAVALRVHQAAVDEIVQGSGRNRKLGARVRKRDEDRIAGRAVVERRVELLEPGPFLGVRQLAVSDVVNAAREGVDRRDRAPLGPRQHHDPVGEVARLAAGNPFDVRVRLLDLHLIAASASRAREGRGLPLKMSHSARSRASSAATPPRPKTAIARPTRPPSRPPSSSPEASSPRARFASYHSSRLSGTFGSSSLTTPKQARSSAGRYTRPSARSRGTSCRKFTSWRPVQTSSESAISSGSSRSRTPSTRRPTGSAECTQYCLRSAQVEYCEIRWSMRFASIRRRNGSRGRSQARIVRCSSRVTAEAGSPV